MEGTCPRCHILLELPATGAYQCERCGLRFEVAVGRPRPAPVPASGGWTDAGHPAAAVPGDIGEAVCAQHPANPASGVCERCGDFMCRLCTTPVEGRLYCPPCFDLLYNRGALQFTQRQFTLPSVALGLGLGGFFASLVCFCVINVFASVPLGIAGLWVALRALKEYRARPELPQRGVTITGLAFSVAALAISAAQVVFWVVAITRNR